MYTISKILENVQAIFLCSLPYRVYFTGLESSFGVLVLSQDNHYFFTDMRYAIAAKKALKGKKICLEIVQNFQQILEFLQQKDLINLAVPFKDISAYQLEALRQKGFTVTDCSAALQEYITLKNTNELQKVQHASTIAAKSFIEILSNIHEGITEKELAGLLEFFMRKFGADNRSFESIVAFDQNTALPHHKPTDKKLMKGMPILVDFGCMVDGYCSDMTRSFIYQPIENNFTKFYLKIHSIVYNAYQTAKKAIFTGMHAAELDKCARDVFRQYCVHTFALKKIKEDCHKKMSLSSYIFSIKEGKCQEMQSLDNFFTHALGHGVDEP